MQCNRRADRRRWSPSVGASIVAPGDSGCHRGRTDVAVEQQTPSTFREAIDILGRWVQSEESAWTHKGCVRPPRLSSCMLDRARFSDDTNRPLPKAAIRWGIATARSVRWLAPIGIHSNAVLDGVVDERPTLFRPWRLAAECDSCEHVDVTLRQVSFRSQVE